MSSTFRFLCAMLIFLGLAGCDSVVTSLDQASTAADTDAGQSLSKKGGMPGQGGGKGSAFDYDQTFSDALGGSGSVQIVSDNKRTLHTASPDFVLDLNFDATAAQPITRVQTDPAGRTESEIRADGECALNCPEPGCSEAPDGAGGVEDRLHDALTRTGDARPLELDVTVGQQVLGQVDASHFIRIRDNNGPGDGAPGYAKIDYGKCGSPECQPVAEFLGPGPDPRDKTVTRTYLFHSGTITIDEKWSDFNSAATLRCDNLDEVIVELAPLAN